MWNSHGSSLLSEQHMDLVPLTCKLIALPLASAFALPGSTPAGGQQHRNPQNGGSGDTRPATSSLPTTQPSSSHRGTGERTTSHGCTLELSSGRPTTSADMRDAQPVHAGPSSHDRPSMSGGQPQVSAGAPQQQQTTSHSQQPTHPSSSDQMGSYRAPQPMPTSSYQSGAHTIHMQQMMQAAAAAYHTMQGMQQMGQQQQMAQGMGQSYAQQAASMPYGSGYNPYMMGPYGPMADGGAEYAAQQQMYRHLAGAGAQAGNPHGGSGHHQSSHDGGDDDDAGARAIKRPRLVWTPQLHKRFEEAIAKLGDAKAVPKNIMQEMNVEGLTRENVASHLQKYRLQNKGSGSLIDGPDDKTSQ